MNLELACLVRSIEWFRSIVIVGSHRSDPIDGELTQRAHCEVDLEGR
jgi:hypothetical protein